MSLLTFCRLLKGKESVVVNIENGVEFTDEDWSDLDLDRRNISRGIITNYSYVLLKEMGSPIHETSAEHLIGAISAGIIRQSLANPIQMSCLMKRLECMD